MNLIHHKDRILGISKIATVLLCILVLPMSYMFLLLMVRDSSLITTLLGIFSTAYFICLSASFLAYFYLGNKHKKYSLIILPAILIVLELIEIIPESLVRGTFLETHFQAFLFISEFAFFLFSLSLILNGIDIMILKKMGYTGLIYSLIDISLIFIMLNFETLGTLPDIIIFFALWLIPFVLLYFYILQYHFIKQLSEKDK